MTIRTRPAAQAPLARPATTARPPRVSDDTAAFLTPKALAELTRFVEQRLHPDVHVSVTAPRGEPGQLELHMAARNEKGEVLLSAMQKFPDLQPALAARDPEFGSRAYAFGALDQLQAFSEAYRADPMALAAKLIKAGELVGERFNGQALEVTGGSLYRKALEASAGWKAR